MAKLIRRTKRIIVRPLQASDYKAWTDAHTTMLPARNTWDMGNKAETEVAFSRYRKLLKVQANDRRRDFVYDLGIFDRKTGVLVGGVAAMEIQRGVGHSAYLGYRIFNRHWRKGYAKEAVKAMFDIAFKDLKLHRLEAGIEPGNRRSILLAKRLGLRREGLKRRAIFLRNQWVDLLVFAVTCEELGYKFRGSVQKRQS
jgi:ribosomal-protein-alanine N-acetyltransferase